MAKPKTKDNHVEEVKSMDFERAVSLYRKDIKPAISKVGEHAQEVSTAYKEIKKGCNIPPAIAKFCFKLAEDEEASRDVQLRALNGLLNALKIGVIAADLVDKAQGIDGTGVIPTVEAKTRPNLVVVPSDGTESDFTDAADTEANDLDLSGENPFEEATEEELSKQTVRGKGRKPKAD